MNKHWLAEAKDNLERLVANILQIPQRDASSFANRVTRAVVVKTGGAATAAGILGLVGTFGSASTGTAIASLSGAAYSTASLYWMGSLIGGGVWAGGILTGGIGIVAAVVAMKMFGSKPRTVEALTEEEQRIVNAALGLVKVFEEQLGINKPVPKSDADFVYNQAWIPLVDSFKSYEDARAVKTLNFKNFVGLANRRRSFEKLSGELRQWIDDPTTGGNVTKPSTVQKAPAQNRDGWLR